MKKLVLFFATTLILTNAFADNKKSAYGVDPNLAKKNVGASSSAIGASPDKFCGCEISEAGILDNTTPAKNTTGNSGGGPQDDTNYGR